MANEERDVDTIPVGPLRLVPLAGCRSLAQKVDEYLVSWRKSRKNAYKDSLALAGYERDTYLVEAETPRFGSGEGKAVLKESIRGDDLYLLMDVTNSNVTYSMNGMANHMSPDDHYSNVKRVIAAANGKARRITVIMPFLYEGRIQTRRGRQSLDCAMMLQELVGMGVSNFITFDAHDARIVNAIPLAGFENFKVVYQNLKALFRVEKNLKIDSDHMMIISPDEGGMHRAVYFANVLGLDVGMFYKRRDYSREVNGRNPVLAHEYLGANVEGKDVIIVDDMISSGETALATAKELKARKANKVFVCATFGLFTGGLNKFDEYYRNGLIDRVFTTNLIYQEQQLLERPYYTSVDVSKYIALIIDNLNHNYSVSELLNPIDRINNLLARYRAGEY